MKEKIWNVLFDVFTSKKKQESKKSIPDKYHVISNFDLPHCHFCGCLLNEEEEKSFVCDLCR